jgi:hypothetical protein
MASISLSGPAKRQELSVTISWIAWPLAGDRPKPTLDRAAAITVSAVGRNNAPHPLRAAR